MPQGTNTSLGSPRAQAVRMCRPGLGPVRAVMRDFIRACCASLTLGIALSAPSVAGPFVLLGNLTESPVRFQLRAPGKEPVPESLAPGAVMRYDATPGLAAVYAVRRAARSLTLEPERAYLFLPVAETYDLQPLVLPAQAGLAAAWRPSSAAASAGDSGPTRPGIVPVKLFVDDEEAARPELWQARLKKRLDAANRIIERHCAMRFEPVAYGTWDSDDATSDFNQSLFEFVREAGPGEAALAIGFSSQYRFRVGTVKLGGIPAPFYPHLLIREWPQKQSEVERLEVLVHELGHYLGAAHSPSTLAVMRPLLGDKQANAKAFHIGYDPLNALAMNVVAEEYRQRPVRHLRQLSFRSKARLACIYLALAEALPEDPAALYFLQVMGIPTQRIETRLAEQRGRATTAGQRPGSGEAP